MTGRSPTATMIATVLIVSFAAGCGYTTKRPFPEDVQSVYVEMFHSKEFRRDLEFDLTEALAKRINMDTPYVIAPREKADTVLSGEIQEVRQNTLGNDYRTDLPRETGATIVASFRWKDLRTGRILMERKQFAYTTTYIRPVGETFYTARMRGLSGMAEQIVEAMETDW